MSDGPAPPTEGVIRAIEHGSLYLNQVFVKRMPKQRIWRTAMRLSILDMAIIGVFVLIFGLLGFGFGKLFALLPGIPRSYEWAIPILFVIVFAAGGFAFGRFAVRFSPYSDSSGEGLMDWVKVKWNSRYKLVNRILGRKVHKEFRETWVDGEPIMVECSVYRGSAPLPRSIGKTNDETELVLLPRNVSTPWVKQTRLKERIRKMEAAQNEG